MELSKIPFLQILHGVFRSGDHPAEIARAKACKEWLLRNMGSFNNTCNPAEKKFLLELYAYYSKFPIPPSRSNFEEWLTQREVENSVILNLTDYDEKVDSFSSVTYADMDVLFENRILEVDKYRFGLKLQVAKDILYTGWNDKKKGVTRKGPADARNYLAEQLNNDAMINGQSIYGGVLGEKEKRDEMIDGYIKRRDKASQNMLKIPTGLPCLDNATNGGLDRGSFYGILGYAKARKTSLARSIALNAASRGFHVLHIPLESSFEEEQMFYNIMYAHTKSTIDRLGSCPISLRDYQAGRIPDELWKKFEESISKDFCIDHVAEFIDEHGVTQTIKTPAVGKKLEVYGIRDDRSWKNIQALIERTHQLDPVDLVVVDYLALAIPADVRNERDEVNQIIKSVKNFLLQKLGGKVAFITPVQGNRDGHEAAAENEGAWEPSGIHMYSEFEKSLDMLMSVFSPPVLEEQGKSRLSICMGRRGEYLAPKDIDVVNECNMFVQSTELGTSIDTKKKSETTGTKRNSLEALSELPDIY